MKLFSRLGLIVMAASLLAACESTHTVKEPTLSGLELQQLQTREFESPLKVVFASVLSVFQDTGYIIDSADTDTGFITAKSPSDSNTTFDLFWGWGKKHKTTKVTAFVEPIGESFTKVRINFVAVDEASKGYGINSRVDTPIEDADIYANVFEKIDETIFIRNAVNSKTPEPSSPNDAAPEEAAAPAPVDADTPANLPEGESEDPEATTGEDMAAPAS